LYLSAFSGPVEGILLIVVIYLITALHPSGPAFWDTPIVSLIPGNYGVELAQTIDKALSAYGIRYKLEYLGVNVAFMIFGALGTIGNIINR
jgi:ethanolaminephosphotransferase